jgi:uncharacterized iron-regulated protein
MNLAPAPRLATLVAFLALALLAAPAAARAPADTVAYRVYTGAGAAGSLDDIIAVMADHDVVFFGETHDDPVAHALEAEILAAAHAAYGASRGVGLGLEMFERDVQLVLDEYLAGLIRERDFLAAARPWPNYLRAYRPLVEYAREHALPVLATNAPGRYASLVAREGEDALGRLGAAALALLPPLPVEPPSEALTRAFLDHMEALSEAHDGGHHGHALDPGALLAAQNLRDAAMAHTLAEALQRQTGTLWIHVNGVFHSEGGLGAPEHLARIAPDARILTISIRPAADLPAGAEGLLRSGDTFVIMTDLAPRDGR